MADIYSYDKDELVRLARGALALLEQNENAKEKHDASQAASALVQPDIEFHHSELCRNSGELKQHGTDSDAAAARAQIQAEYPSLLAFFEHNTLTPQGVQASAAANADWGLETEDHILFTTDDGTAYAMRLAHQHQLIVLPPCCRGGPPCNHKDTVQGSGPTGYRCWRIIKAPSNINDILDHLAGPKPNSGLAR